MAVGARALAETSQRPEGLTQRVVLNVLETFFRRPLVFLLPLIVLTGLGVLTATSRDDEYQSVGVLNASSGSLLSELTGDAPRFGYERASDVTARNIEQLVSTNLFLDQVIDAAGLRPLVDGGQLRRDDVRHAISAEPSGDTLVAVSATSPDPMIAQRLATATLARFVEFIAGSDVADATVRTDTYTTIRDENQQRLDEADGELDEYLAGHPAADEATRPIAEVIEIDRLRDQVTQAEAAYRDAQANLDEAQVAGEVARAVVDRQLRVIDQPLVPTAPIAGMRQAAMIVVLFGVLGVVLSLGLVVASALLDRSVRSPQDLATTVGLDVLAVVPTARRRGVAA